MFHLVKLYNICVFSEFDTVTSVSVTRRVKTKMFPVSATLIEFQGHSCIGKTSKKYVFCDQVLFQQDSTHHSTRGGLTCNCVFLLIVPFVYYKNIYLFQNMFR